MSIGFETPRTQHEKKKKHAKEKDAKGAEKKRKRKLVEHAESAPLLKRSRSNKRSTSPQRPSPPLRPENAARNLKTSPGTSPFCVKQASLYLPIAPISQQSPVQALCAEHLSPLLMTYYPPLRGVIMSYRNPRCCFQPDDVSSTDAGSGTYARAIDEYAATFVWLTADFVLFRPGNGDVLEGFINLKNESGVGLVCWNFFNANIDRSHLPDSWTWVAGGITTRKNTRLKKLADETGSNGESSDEDSNEEETDGSQGHFQDEKGNRIEGFVTFGVRKVETSPSIEQENGFLSIEATMLTPEEERRRRQNETIEMSSIASMQ